MRSCLNTGRDTDRARCHEGRSWFYAVAWSESHLLGQGDGSLQLYDPCLWRKADATQRAGSGRDVPQTPGTVAASCATSETGNPVAVGGRGSLNIMRSGFRTCARDQSVWTLVVIAPGGLIVPNSRQGTAPLPETIGLLGLDQVLDYQQGHRLDQLRDQILTWSAPPVNSRSRSSRINIDGGTPFIGLNLLRRFLCTRHGGSDHPEPSPWSCGRAVRVLGSFRRHSSLARSQ